MFKITNLLLTIMISQLLIFSMEADESIPKIGVVVSSYNRSEYLVQTLEALKEKTFGPDIIVELVIIDDGSGPEARGLVDNFHLDGILTFRIRVAQNMGIANVLKLGWELLVQRDCDFLCNLDSDVLLKDNWLSRLLETYNKAFDKFEDPRILVTGFNTKNHSVTKEYMAFYVKKDVGGVNLFFPSLMYADYVQEVLDFGRLWDWNLNSRLQADGIPIVCTKPSVVQHIGIEGMNSSARYSQYFDYAEDFDDTP